MRGATLRGYVTVDGDVLLQWPAQVPGWEGEWLGEILRTLHGHDVTISLRDNGSWPSAWLQERARAAAGARLRPGRRVLRLAPAMTKRRCLVCGKRLPLTLLYRLPHGRGYLRGYRCRPCYDAWLDGEQTAGLRARTVVYGAAVRWAGD